MTTPTYDYESEQSEILRRQKVAEALMTGGLTGFGPTETAQGGYAVKRSPLEALAKVAQAYLGNVQMQGAREQQRALGERYRGDLKTGMEQFFSTMEGGKRQTIPGAEEDPLINPQMTKPDPRRAVLEAMSSNHPGVQKMGEAYFSQLNKDRLGPKELSALSTPESVLRNPNDPTTWAPKIELKDVTSGGVQVDQGGNIRAPGAPTTAPGAQATGAQGVTVGANGLPQGPGWQTLKVGDDLYQMTATGLKKLDQGTKVTTNFSPSVKVMGQKAGLEAWAKNAAETVTQMSESARQSVKLMTQLTQLESLSRAGTNAGPTAGIQTFVQGLANTAGLKIDPKTLNNSQAFESVATQAWAALMQQNGGARGLVKEESQKLAESLPALLQTPQGRAQITAVLRAQAQANIEDAKKANQEFAAAVTAENPALFTQGLSATQLPQSPPIGPVPGGTQGKPLSLDEYLKQQGVR